MKEKNNASARPKKDRVYAVNENKQGASKGQGNADTQQHSRQEHEQSDHQQSSGRTSIGQEDGRDAGRGGQQQR
jgi:hypothetical protein